ncbi:MAG: MauE/DoxX family redox-associated membrane protein [Chlamydiota bacterium]
MSPRKVKPVSYWPLLLILLLITAVSLVIALKEPSLSRAINAAATTFMAGFFIVFSGFKLLDLRGFQEGYAQYDLLAKRFRPYGLLYPFLELGLGLGYLAGRELPALYAFTFLLMSFSSLGVIQALREKKRLSCSCLGTLLQVPLTTVTLTEDLIMALMGLIMFLR